MPRKSNLPQPLTLESEYPQDEQQHPQFQNPKSPLSPKSPKSPHALFRFGTKKPQPQDDEVSMQAADSPRNRADFPQSQTLPDLHKYSGGEEQQREREKPAKATKSGFFNNHKASKTPSRSDRSLDDSSMSRDAEPPAMSSKVSSQEPARGASAADKTVTRKPVAGPSKSDVSIASTADTNPSTNPSSNNGATKKKPKPFSLLGRTKSIRGDEQGPRDLSPSNGHLDSENSPAQPTTARTAPLRHENDRSFRDIMSSNVRQHSADRVPTKARDMPHSRDNKDAAKPAMLSGSFREGGGFLNNLKSTASKGAGAFSKGLFGKSGRSGSTVERELPVDDEHYELKVINRSLVDQTRITRISKRLEDSRDKTEFWMPSFPWRAIDYLNYKGSDVEGLYRVPGSGPQIKKWQRRFDEELDIDLFEQDDLYDINIIGSMLKAWLRELPDELFPKEAQDRVARESNMNGSNETVPQVLIDELSNLSPFRYYLLFAITCHLSLLLAHSEKNKMDYRNLCICFQPCMKIDAFSFKFLVCDWRDCWKGCKTEKDFTEAEYAWFESQETNPPKSSEGRSSTAVESERNVSSSDSSKPSSVSLNEQKWAQASGQPKKKLPLSQTHGNLSTVSTTLTVVQERSRTPPRGANMRPLSPIKPLSPIGL